MTLLNTARALDDQRFIWRVRAALLRVATDKVTSTDELEARYAEYVLQYPMHPVPFFESLCAADPQIASHIVVDEWSTVNTEDVPDELFYDMADSRFLWLASIIIPDPSAPVGYDPSAITSTGSGI